MKYLALDVETTGLDPADDLLLEVAAIPLDKNFKQCGDEFVAVAHYPWEQIDRRLNDRVREMHTKNGLLNAVYLTKKRTPTIDGELAAMISVGTKGPKPWLLGSSVHFDRSFLKVHCPLACSFLHHRHMDATTLRELFPEVEMPPRPKVHRALDDIRVSIEVVRRVRDAWQESRVAMDFYEDHHDLRMDGDPEIP